MPDLPYLIGLTGGIGSGKTTVADLFADLGAGIVDTDVIAHRLTAAGGEAMPAIAQAFGNDVIGAGGALDRAAMRSRVFALPQERVVLERILHPLIRQAVNDALLEPAIRGRRYCFLVVPLLFESMSYRLRLRRTLAVDCSENHQVTRVQARSGLAAEEVRNIMAAQVPRAIRLQLADDIVANNAGRGELEPQVQRLHHHYLLLAASQGMPPRH